MTSTATLPAPDPAPPADDHVPRVEIVVPVRDEENDLEPGVRSHFTAKTVGGDTVYDLTSPIGQAAG
jgi:hypothetical protein